MEAIGTQQYKALFSAHLQSSHTVVVLLTNQVTSSFSPMGTSRESSQ